MKVTITRPLTRITASTEDLAADYKSRGMDQQRAWSEYLRDRALSPGIDAMDFYEIFQTVAPRRLRGEAVEVDFAATHIIDFGDGTPTVPVMVTYPDGPEGPARFVSANGATGGNPPGQPLPVYFRPLDTVVS